MFWVFVANITTNKKTDPSFKDKPVSYEI